MKRVVSCLASLGCAALVACSSGSPGPAPAEPPRIDQPKRVRVLWSANVGSADRFTFLPELAGGSVYAAARNGSVTAEKCRGSRRIVSSADAPHGTRAR